MNTSVLGWHHVFQPAGFPQLRHYRSTSFIDVFQNSFSYFLFRPLLEICRELAMRLREERPVERRGIHSISFLRRLVLSSRRKRDTRARNLPSSCTSPASALRNRELRQRPSPILHA